jgi:SAM-dependent methyltransferase
MIEDEAAQQVVTFYDAILKSRGIALAPDNMILDYGCGSGRHTYEYIDAGFRNAFGYDVQNYVALPFIRHSPGRSRHLAVPLKFIPMLRQAFRFAHTRAILSRKIQRMTARGSK